MWSVEELQELQAILLIARDSQFDDIYQETGDNRRLRNHVLKVIKTWGISSVAMFSFLLCFKFRLLTGQKSILHSAYLGLGYMFFFVIFGLYEVVENIFTYNLFGNLFFPPIRSIFRRQNCGP